MKNFIRTAPKPPRNQEKMTRNNSTRVWFSNLFSSKLIFGLLYLCFPSTFEGSPIKAGDSCSKSTFFISAICANNHTKSLRANNVLNKKAYMYVHTCINSTWATFSFHTSCSLQNSTDLRNIWRRWHSEWKILPPVLVPNLKTFRTLAHSEIYTLCPSLHLNPFTPEGKSGC